MMHQCGKEVDTVERTTSSEPERIRHGGIGTGIKTGREAWLDCRALVPVLQKDYQNARRKRRQGLGQMPQGML